jgi:hypothetical protein
LIFNSINKNKNGVWLISSHQSIKFLLWSL